MSSAQTERSWRSLSAAAALIDVPEHAILNRAVPWQTTPVQHRIRFQVLTLDRDIKGSPRFFSPDLEKLLSSSDSPLDVQASGGGLRSSGETKKPRYKVVERGIYRSTTNSLFSERPFIEGKRTWRSLRTTKI